MKVPEEIGFIINTFFPNAYLKTVRGEVEVWVGNCWGKFKKIDCFKKGTQWICYFLTQLQLFIVEISKFYFPSEIIFILLENTLADFLKKKTYTDKLEYFLYFLTLD